MPHVLWISALHYGNILCLKATIRPKILKKKKTVRIYKEMHKNK